MLLLYFNIYTQTYTAIQQCERCIISVIDRNTMSGRQFLVDYDAYQTIAVW